MRRIILIFSACSFASFAACAEDKAVCSTTTSLQESDGLAAALKSLRDQDQEKAFRTFLRALDEGKKIQATAPTEEERRLYNLALKVYLEGAATPQETAVQILKTYSEAVQEHPEFFELSLVMATAYGNLGRFEEFFNIFYRACSACPDHYLAWKMKAVLHIKLFERCRNKEEREAERSAIRLNVQQALQKNSQDIGLYKLWLLFAEEQNKHRELVACLNKILDSPMIMTRSDLSFFAQQTLDARQFELTQRLIDKGRNWYPYSRCLDSVQLALDEFKTRNRASP